MKLWQRSRVVCVLAYFGCNEDYVFYFAKWLARCLQPNRRYKAKKIIAIYIRRTYIVFFCCWGKYGNHPFNGMRFISTPRLLRTDYPSNNGGSSENSILFGRIFFFHFLGRSFNLMIIKNNVPFHILMAGVILPFLPLWFANIWLDVLTSKVYKNAHSSRIDFWFVLWRSIKHLFDKYKKRQTSKIWCLLLRVWIKYMRLWMYRILWTFVQSGF